MKGTAGGSMEDLEKPIGACGAKRSLRAVYSGLNSAARPAGSCWGAPLKGIGLWLCGVHPWGGAI